MSEKPADLRALIVTWRRESEDEEGYSLQARAVLTACANELEAALAAGEPAVPSGTLITRLYAPNPPGEPAGTTPQERARAALKGFEAYIEWNGPMHEDDCPGDDTCECSEKFMNDGVNEAHRLVSELAKGPAKE